MMIFKTVFSYLAVAILVLAAMILILELACVLGSFSVMLVVMLILCLGETLCDVVRKIIGDPKNILIETGNIWLAIISPCHKLARWRRNTLSSKSKKALMVLLFIAELMLLPLSLLVGAVLMIPETFRDLFC